MFRGTERKNRIKYFSESGRSMEANILSLHELNNLVRGVLANTFNQQYWIRAEMSDVRMNQNGHCYLEFIEKDSNNRNIVAKARGSIWANVFKLIKAYFESETGQAFASGLKVLVQVSVEFHELYGYSLNVHNIDPSYTLGDQARNRMQIIKQLEEEGVLNLNKELELDTISNTIAVISSPTAAGYEDFCNQLENNSDGFSFYTHLFPAIMQGDRTESSIIEALDKIYENIDLFDAVVIIRGGGATSDLSSFDSYLLAANCAQFPLPIITGIGHERDDTVLDVVAHTRAKTPTAVAEFLIRKMQYVATDLFDIQDAITAGVTLKLNQEAALIETLSTHFSYLTKDRTKDQLAKLQSLSDKIRNATNMLIQRQQHQLSSCEQHLKLVSPENTMKRGYTITLRGNTIIKSAKEIKAGDAITTLFSDGKISSKAE